MQADISFKRFHDAACCLCGVPLCWGGTALSPGYHEFLGPVGKPEAGGGFQCRQGRHLHLLLPGRVSGTCECPSSVAVTPQGPQQRSLELRPPSLQVVANSKAGLGCHFPDIGPTTQAEFSSLRALYKVGAGKHPCPSQDVGAARRQISRVPVSRPGEVTAGDCEASGELCLELCHPRQAGHSQIACSGLQLFSKPIDYAM